IKLSEEFFGGNMAAIEVSAEIITLHEENDIINQYIMFSKIIDEQIKIYGRTPKAVIEAIRICKDANILKEYLEKHEKEVVDIMEELYDQKAIFAMFAESERAEGREEGREEGVIKTTLSGIKNLMQNMKLTAEQAMQALSIPVSERDKYHSLLGEN
ncbi:MAG: hypothetical protein LIO44_02235, partial [Eubacterium sp.]|nr:hypothetical protein [Eubacterium sp.]